MQQPLDEIPIHAVLLKGATSGPTDSKILWWGQGGIASGSYFTHVFEWQYAYGGNPLNLPALPTASSLIPRPITGLDAFCGGHSTLADGRLLISGGTVASEQGDAKGEIFAPSSGAYTPQFLHKPRWYPSSTTMANGRVVVTGGQAFRSVVGFGGKPSPTTYSHDLSPIFATREVQRETTAVLNPVTALPPARAWHSMVYTDPKPDQDGPGCCVYFPYNKSAIVFGGLGESGPVNDLWKLTRVADTDQWTWTEISTTTRPPSRYKHTAVYDDATQTMYVYGGIGANGERWNDVWWISFATSQPEWHQYTLFGGAGPVARAGHVAVWDNSLDNGVARRHMVVYGGVDESDNPLGDVWILDLAATLAPFGYEISELALYPGPAARSGHAGAFFSQGKKLVVFGGQKKVNGTPTLVNDVWFLRLDSPTSAQWEAQGAISGTPPSPRQGAAVAMDKEFSRLTIAGGNTQPDGATEIVSNEWFVLSVQDDSNRYWDTQSHGALAGGGTIGGTLVYDPRNIWMRASEIYDPALANWTLLGSTSALKVLPLYPNMYHTPDGNLVFAGPGEKLSKFTVPANSQNYSQAAWSDLVTVPKVYDPTLGFDVEVEGGATAMYRPGKILRYGGFGRSDNVTSEIDLTATPPQVTTSRLLDDPYRTQHNLTILPTGDVLLTGGLGTRDVISTAVKTARIWNADLHAWGGVLSPNPQSRDYHSTSLLLPDGRVVTGGGDKADNPKSVECYWPPYFFLSGAGGQDIPATRPTIAGAPSSISWSATATAFTICTPDAASVTRIGLLRPGAVTHGFDQNQLYIPLEFTYCGAGQTLVVNSPTSSTDAPPGDYLLVICTTQQGRFVPSVARWIRVGSTPSGGVLCTTCPPGCPVLDAETQDGWQVENTILTRSLTGSPQSDWYRLATSPDVTNGTVHLRIRENEAETTHLRAVSLLAVDRDSLDSSYAVDGTIHLGDVEAAGSAELEGLGDVTPLVQDGARYLVGHPGDVVTLNLDGSEIQNMSLARGADVTTGVGGGLILGASGKPDPEQGGNRLWRDPEGGNQVDAAVLSQTGILVQVPDGTGGWNDLAHVYPREDFAETVVDSVPDGPVRLEFVGEHKLRLAGRLHYSEQHATTSVAPLVAATHSRLGSVLDAIAAPEDDAETIIAPGDTVDLTFDAPPVTPGRVRDWYLVSTGVYTSDLSAVAPASVHGELADARTLALHPTRPNPFAVSTVIRFDVPVNGRVQLQIFDAQGRRVRTLTDRAYKPGKWSAVWDGRDALGQRLAHGVYVVRLTQGVTRIERKLTLL